MFVAQLLPPYRLTRGYDGGYEPVKVTCRELRGLRPLELVSRFETGPGAQAREDFLGATQARAMSSISTRASFGSRATSTVARAGGLEEK